MHRLAASLLLLALALHAEDGDDLLGKARAAWGKGDFEGAVEAYRGLRDGFPGHDFVKGGDAQFWLWCSLANSGKKREAIAEIQAFLEKHPGHGSCDYALYFLGQHLRELGDEEKAKAAWERLLKDFPKSQMGEMARDAIEGKGVTAPAREERFNEDDFRGAAEAAGRWLLKVAEEKDGGLTWTEYEGTKARPTSLYEGQAGILLYFMNLNRATHDRKWFVAAEKTAEALAARASKDKDGVCWPDESEPEDDVIAQEPSPGYYVGTAGIGNAFLAMYEWTKRAPGRDFAVGAADWVLANAKRDKSGIHWGEDTDIISGTAGTGLFLIAMDRAIRITGERKYLEGAQGAADWLLSVGVKDGDGLKWKSTAQLERFYTGYSHGTAGIADFLLKVYEATQDKKYLEGAEAGARWLLSVSKEERGGLKWFHYQPDHTEAFQTGWCHGPAGTARLFLDLHRVTEKQEYLDVAVKGGEWLVAEVEPANPAAVHYGVSMCCGAAGVGDYFLELAIQTRDDRWIEHAAGVARWLIRHAKRDGEGLKWTNYDQPDEKGVVYYGTGHMTGAAGVGTFLLRLDCTLRGEVERIVPTLDKPRYAESLGPAGNEYVVLSAVDPKGPWHKAAERLAAYRKGTIIPFRPDRLASAHRQLARVGARHVAVVLQPEDLDVNLHRRLLAISTRMDDDAFCDFAIGYITGPTPEAALKLVESAIAVEKVGAARTAVEAAVVSEVKSFTTDDPPMALAGELGFEGKSIYWATREADPDVLGFVQDHLKDLEGRGVVMLSGNGDPEGIWLFADDRNIDDSKHWPFDSKRVGEDPNGEMPRILAKDLRGLDLSRAVVWSGTCHSGVTRRAFIGPDIVSTFGTVDCVTKYMVPADRSLALAILGNGPAAYLAPIGPNHGYATLVEAHRALATGMPLGDVMRTSYNEVVLAEGCRLSPPVFVPGEPEPAEDPMRGNAVNRLLFGDPACRPFPAADRDAVKATRDGDRVHCEVVDGDAGVFWDMYAGGQGAQERIYVVVELPGDFPEVGSVTTESKDVAITGCRWGVEEIDGKRWIHLVANAAQGAFAKEGAAVEFKITPR
ncbi:MAG: lanthionine synthetase LanC family protein [Planctomycetota bacterium]